MNIGAILQNGLKRHYYSYLFMLLYFVITFVVYGFYIYLVPALSTVSYGTFVIHAFNFLTSPFSPLENLKFAGNYESVVINGLIPNFLEILIFMLVLQLYMDSNFYLLSRFFKFKHIFYTSIIATYILSLLVWLIKGQPSTGTSIIGFSLILFIELCLILDVVWLATGIRKHRNKLTNKQILAAGVAVFLFLVIIGIIAMFDYGTYILSNSSYYLHLAGGLIFLFLLSLYFFSKVIRPLVPFKHRSK